MLQENKMVAYSKALEKTYNKFCRVVEKEKVLNNNGSTSFKDVEVLRDIPCRVSYKTANIGSEVGLLSSTKQIIKLFISSQVEISSNSRIYIKGENEEFEKEYFKSSEPKIYETHQEIELILKRH